MLEFLFVSPAISITTVKDKLGVKTRSVELSVLQRSSSLTLSLTDITEAENLDCDYLLLDTAYKDKIGGGGEKFNWDLIPKNLTKPYFLAGGLSAENVAQAIKTINPYAVDLSSSVETEGYKDREKVRKVIDIVRRV